MKPVKIDHWKFKFLIKNRYYRTMFDITNSIYAIYREVLSNCEI